MSETSRVVERLRSGFDAGEQGGIEFERTADGVACVDPVERVRWDLSTDPPGPEFEEVTSVAIPAPVDRGIRLSVDELTFPNMPFVVVRDADWNHVRTVQDDQQASFDVDEWVLDVAGPVKTYLHVTGEFSVRLTDEVKMEFGTGTDVVLAARSKHERPRSSVTTTPTPEGLRETTSAFGSALKTTSPERSWPNLRGHPPVVEVGDQVDTGRLTPPCPEIRIEVPDDLRSIFPVAPLAYYLGARVVASDGGPPRLATESGFEYPLVRGSTDLETVVERTLKQVVFLECVVREEGLFDLDLHERDAVEAALSLDHRRVYEQPPEVRLSSLLSVEFDAVAEYVPDWQLTAHVPDDPHQVEILPYLVSDLAVVRVRSSGESSVDGPTTDPPGDDRDFPRSVSGERSLDSFVNVESTDSVSDVWTGEKIPLDADFSRTDAYEHYLDLEPQDPPIDIAVVCNDPEMADELDVKDAYSRDVMPMDVDVYRELSTSALETLVEFKDVDYLHYVGHASPEGLHCPDGKLDLAGVDSTQIKTFVLNACKSFEQGVELVDAGAIGGIATVLDVYNDPAVEFGRLIARLLNAGCTLRAAVSIARETNFLSNRYHVIGDSGVQLVQPDSGAIVRYVVHPTGESGEYDLTVHVYPSSNGIGGVFHPHVDRFNYHLTGNSTPRRTVSQSELETLLDSGRAPVQISSAYEDDLVWNTDLDLDRL